MPGFRSEKQDEKRLTKSAATGTNTRVAAHVSVCLAFVIVMSALVLRPASAASCTPGWEVDTEVDNSFTWKDSGLLPAHTVTWTGIVQLIVDRDGDCTIVGVELAYTGTPVGGALALTGSPLVSFTVQYPSSFTSYADKGLNAYGSLVSWNPPAGDYATYIVTTNFGINSRGADEYAIKGKGVGATVTNVGATFDLPRYLLGQTIQAQIHVGPNKCECKVTALDVPAQPTPPPGNQFDFTVSVDPTSGYVQPGGSVGATVTATLTSGTANSVTFAASGLPTGSSATFVPTAGQPTCSCALTISTAQTTPDGTYPVSVSASDGTTTHSTTYLLTVGSSPPSATWSVYVHGHEDDWQLFESPNSVADYNAGHKLLFILLTAGDAGRPPSYWQAREEADKASVKFFAGTASEGSSSVAVCYTQQETICHNVREWTYGSTTTLFFRLPDGNTDGNGFPSTGFVSMSKLRDGLIPSLTAVDGTATYNSWQDLYLTVGASISVFAPADASTTINAPDFDRSRQSFEGKSCNGCSDHPDHLAVADIVYVITIGSSAPWSRAWFIDYPLGFADSRYPANLNDAQYQTKKDLFTAYSNRLKELTGEDTLGSNPVFWENCFHREYSRVA